MPLKIDKINPIQKSVVESIMKVADIAQVCVATVKGREAPITQDFGDESVGRDTIFGAASLSKPVFSYLVLKLVEAGKLTLDMKGLNDIFPFLTFCEQYGFKWKNSEGDTALINAVTPSMILSHKTGFDLSRDNQVNHQFDPGQEYYRYSGLSLFYLQKVIEKITQSTIEELAQEYVFGPVGMSHSSFGGNPCVANSLTTTAEDYALFVQSWMNDEKLQYAFQPQIRMTQDPWAKETVSDENDLKYVAECLGFQLEIDENGKPLTAFKTGDMGPWRAWVAIDLSDDLKERRATVYFTKGPNEGNGHILADTVIKPHFQLNHGLRWFKEKYGFATGIEENWQHLQETRLERGADYQKRSPKLPRAQEKSPNSSTQQMLQQMHFNSLSPNPEKMKAGANKLIHKTEERKEDLEEDRKFNPTPFSTSNDPYKK